MVKSIRRSEPGRAGVASAPQPAPATRRALSLVLSLGLALGLAAQPAGAQTPAPAPQLPPELIPPQTPSPGAVETEAEKPKPPVRKSREERLAEAFEKLKSENPATRSAGEKTIERLWSRSGSASMDLLLIRAKKAMKAEKWTMALRHLTDLVNLQPDFPEAWNARATVHFKLENYGEALADIAEVLAREPKHFGALTGLGLIMDQIERPKEALTAYERALAVHPHLEGPKEAVKRLKKRVEGSES